MEFAVTTTSAEKTKTECVVIGVHERRRLTPSAAAVDAASDGVLSRWLKNSGFEARTGQTQLLHDLPGCAASRVLAVGFGSASDVDDRRYRRSLRAAMDALVATRVRRASVHLAEVAVGDRDDQWRTRQIAEAGCESAYRFDRMKSEAKRSPAPRLKDVKVGLPEGGSRDAAALGLERGAAVGAGLDLTRDLGNLPGNVCTPSYLADQARALGRRHRTVKVGVKGEAEMKRLGMETLLSVARGSREPAKLITLEYRGAARGSRPVALVGKGVTFDTGGISIKPAGTMDEMKFDMCGAASVLGTFEAVARLGLAVNLVGVIPATENMPDGNASKPGDIVTSMSGQTVEILNTDAEGRLILCDALTYVHRFDPVAVVDIATLTGACVIALGSHASGLFSNDDALGEALVTAGDDTGDRAWPMPVWQEYDEQLKSNFADMANIGGREGGAITAAAFLGRFTRELAWAHLDIAGTAWKSGKAKGATGRPVRLLVQYLLDRAGDKRRTKRRAR